MDISDEMLDYKPYLPKDSIIYLRKEKNSTYTIRFISSKLEQNVNEAFISLINLFDGNNSVKSIIEKLRKKYSNISIDVFKSDIINVIIFLSELQLLIENGENPFLSRFKIQITDIQKLYLANYTDFFKIKEFFESTPNKSNYIEYYNPLKIGKNYSEIVLINNAIKNKEYLFILEENEDIKLIINLKRERESLVSLEYMKIEKNLKNVDKIINYVLISILKIDKYNLRVFRANFFKDDNKNLVAILKDVGFGKAFLLKDELGNSIDIEEYNYYI